MLWRQTRAMTPGTTDDSPFSYADRDDPLWKRLAIGMVERMSGARHIERLYRAKQAEGWRDGEQRSFFRTAISALSIDVQYDADRLANASSQGPLVVVANHPFGVLDGIVMCALMERARPDFLVLTNSVLMRAPEMRARMLPIDFAQTSEAQRINVASRAKALDHLKGGGCVVIFPAGAVSTSPDRMGRLPAIDGAWSPFAARLVLSGRASVLPIYFPGQNSRLFQIVSHIHPNLRLGLFFHEVRRRIGAPFPVAIGETATFDAFAHLDRAALLTDLRARVYGLDPQPRPR
ncbi:MAG: lysophospholipid acyltransferase family protein [Beijerinckiaceae bacterium]|nr:lysophospholipid acyltransferase family protein [Beijerinckiaceae bacterium]